MRMVVLVLVGMMSVAGACGGMTEGEPDPQRNCPDCNLPPDSCWLQPDQPKCQPARCDNCNTADTCSVNPDQPKCRASADSGPNDANDIAVTDASDAG
jgi:hypothetical protein